MVENLLLLAAMGEAATGLVLLAYPTSVVRLLFGAEIAGAGLVIGRIAGISLIALGLACLPGNNSAGSSSTRAFWAMLCYSLLATLYLAYLGISGEWVGRLLWLAVVVHAVLTILLVRAWRKDRRARRSA